MAFIKLYREKLARNYELLSKLFAEHEREWAVVSKMLCGNRLYLEELIGLGARSVCDSRISNLAEIKDIDPSVETIYIKPPAKRSIPDVVRYADISFNTERFTIELLSEEAQRQGKIHRVMIMIELGDLREGIMGSHLMEFYESILQLPHIEVAGIGANLNCLNGVMPSEDKLIQMSLYEQLIEAKFNVSIPWVSGGTSVIISLLQRGQVPSGVNHFRVGETLYFGNNLITEEPIEGMHNDVFKLFAEVIEITEKPRVPIGYLGENPSGASFEIDEEDYGKTSYRAILDIGLLDVDAEFLLPDDEKLTFLGASSDMLVLDLGNDPYRYKVGDLVSFRLKYMGALNLLNSDYIGKELG
jgi:predicted amino acid racemase